jgi:signal transduction histidine kinase
LRWRVAAAATALGALLSVLFAVAIFLIVEQYEQLLVTELLDSQAQDYSRALAADPRAALPRGRRVNAWLRRSDGSGDVPARLQAVGPGIHEELDGLPEGLSVGVVDIAQGRLYFTIDVSGIETLEAYLAGALLAVIVLGTALSAWLGLWLAGLSLRPLTRLVADVDALPAAPRATTLAAGLADEEVGRRATAIDRYQARGVDADAEERRFFADASHELRTPIAVVRGVGELLVDDPDARPDQQRWLARLDRGLVELTLLLDVLLGLARRREPALEPVCVGTVVGEALRSLATADAIEFRVDAGADIAWILPPREAALVLRGVLGRLVGTSAAGTLSLCVQPQALELDFTAAPTAATSAQAGGDGHSTLVGRLAQVMGWRIESDATEAATRRARIVGAGHG